MRSHINPQVLGAEKRFEALVKKEMMEHQSLISSHHKEMQDLRTSLSLAMERFESLSQHTAQEVKEFKEHATSHISLIKERMKTNDDILIEQRKIIESLHQQINEFHEIYSSKKSIEKLKSDFDLAIKANTVSHLNSFQEFQRELKFLISNLKQDLIKLRCDMALTISELDKKIESNFYSSRIDKDGVSKEIRVYDKTIFVLEKKVENIYTLIDRLNKRGEVCHKPE